MSDREVKRILDVGCGLNKYAGAIGLDYSPGTAAYIIHDLAVVPYPFEDDEFDEIICRYVIEHVPDVLALTSEMHRIPKAAGTHQNRHAALLEPRLAR